MASMNDPRRSLKGTLLKSYAHYVRWSNGRLSDGQSGWGYPPPRSAADFEGAGRVIANRREELKHHAPAAFPCFGFIVCTSCRDEESAPFYLYADDLSAMGAALQKTEKASA